MRKESQKKKYSEAKEFVDNFIEFISDSDDKSEADIDRVLQENGIDIKKLVQNVQGMVGDALEKERLAWQQKAITSRAANVEKYAKKNPLLSRLNKGELLARINKIFQSGDPDFSFAHRNLKPEHLSEEELRDILSEYEQLEDKE
jgi:hypothetical protein